jgi:hypothetical protein
MIIGGTIPNSQPLHSFRAQRVPGHTLQQHKRISVDSIVAKTRTEILQSWADADINYTVIINVGDSTPAAGARSLTFEPLRVNSATRIGALINNPTRGPARVSLIAAQTRIGQPSPHLAHVSR